MFKSFNNYIRTKTMVILRGHIQFGDIVKKKMAGISIFGFQSFRHKNDSVFRGFAMD